MLYNTKNWYPESVEIPESIWHLFAAPYKWVELQAGEYGDLRYLKCKNTLDIRIIVGIITQITFKEFTTDHFKCWGLSTQQLPMYVMMDHGSNT